MIGLVILAGGQGKRMGGQDKGWCDDAGKPFIQRTLETIQQSPLADQLQIVISANRNLNRYRQFGFPVISDLREGYCGPLAGLEAALHFGAQNTITRWITWPIDSLALDEDYIDLMSDISNDQTAVLSINGKAQFAHLSMTIEKLPSLTHYLDSDKRSIRGWIDLESTLVRDWLKPTNDRFNINYPHSPSFHKRHRLGGTGCTSSKKWV